jgi:hypothetical protein
MKNLVVFFIFTVVVFGINNNARAAIDNDVLAGKVEVRARHILVKTKNEAIKLLRKLRNGEDFADLATRYSTAPSGNNGGDLGYFDYRKMVPNFANAAFKLKPGEVSPPVLTQFGWHLIKIEDRRFKDANKIIRQKASRTVNAFYEIKDVFPEFKKVGDLEFALTMHGMITGEDGWRVQDRILSSISSRIKKFRSLTRATLIPMLTELFEFNIEHLSPGYLRKRKKIKPKA